MKNLVILHLFLFIYINQMVSQEKEVIKIAKEFYHSATDLYYFKNDETLKSKSNFKLSELFRYSEGTYFIKDGIKTIIIMPVGDIDENLKYAYEYLGEEGIYKFAVRGKSRTVLKDNQPIYRFYPYRNTIVFEQF